MDILSLSIYRMNRRRLLQQGLEIVIQGGNHQSLSEINPKAEAKGPTHIHLVTIPIMH